jgi:S1-C subfamily serine protease
MSHAISAFALLYLSLLPVLSYGSAQEVANQLFPKTVLLNMNDTSGRPLALGSGFVLKKGYIVSNYHVVVGSGVHRSEFLAIRYSEWVTGDGLRDGRSR